MRKKIGKIIFNENLILEEKNVDVIGNVFENIKSIYNNEEKEDFGIEKVIRLFLASSQLLFPGTYIKHFSSKLGFTWRILTTDFYVIFKMLFPLAILYYGWLEYRFLKYFIIWFLLETFLIIPLLIFASDKYSRPRSYSRSMVLFFLNYLEIAFDFAVLYSSGNYLNHQFHHWYDPVYFSMITSTTIGFGEFYPITFIGKLLVCMQGIIALSFIILFINFFVNKIDSKGYFSAKEKD